jgi:hypothetical protein
MAFGLLPRDGEYSTCFSQIAEKIQEASAIRQMGRSRKNLLGADFANSDVGIIAAIVFYIIFRISKLVG